jgi:BASS family bile acid:Na+ symporter
MTLLAVTLLILEASHVLTVLSVALEAPLHASATLVREPRQLLRVLLSMGVIMPVLTVVAVASFDLLPAVKLALVALAVSPVPPIILHRTHHEEQHYPMALFLTTCALAPVLAPLTFGAASWALGKDVGFGPGHLLPHVGLAIVAPLIVGWGLRHLVPASYRAAKPIARVANWGLVASALTLVVLAWPSVIQLVGNGTFISFALFAATGLFVGHRIGGPSLERRAALALATACRHPAIAVEIAHATYPGDETAGAAVIGYVLVSVACAIPYLLWEQRKKLALGVASTPDAAVGRVQ